MKIVQYRDHDGQRRIGLASEDGATVTQIEGFATTYQLAGAAIERHVSLAELAAESTKGEVLDFGELLRDHRVLAPLDHPDPAHCIVAGTGLTHLGSAATRNAMHAGQANQPETDSMKMFRWGVEGGKPAKGKEPAQPEWFYKGDGSIVVPPEGELASPAFALDGGEESELVGLYLIDPDGAPRRLGFALGNEFSDHVMEKQNYLYLAHSKLRPCSIGPELFVGELPRDIRGTARILRQEQEIWSGEFLTGADNMSYEFEGLEHHHFKYAAFRRPGDVHLHFFGTSLLSFASQVAPQPGDRFEISAPPFTQPLRNTLRQAEPVAPPCRPL